MNWRDIPEAPYETWSTVLRPKNDALAVPESYRIVRTHSALCLAQLLWESGGGTSPLALAADNPLGLRPRPNDNGPTVSGPFRKFDYFADALTYWWEKVTDPTYAYANTVTLEDFIHVYSPDSDNQPGQEAEYVTHIRAKLNEWGIPDQEGPPPPPTPFPANVRVDLVHRGSVPLEQQDAEFTIHNTGNTVPAASEHDFFAQGGGDQGVLVHLVVDETEIIQLTEFWKQGIHAGNVTGNRTSIAMEMTARESVFDDVERNGARAMAMVYTRDPRLDWSGAEQFTFSPDRTIDHRGWAGANPDCPHVLIDRHGDQDVQFMIDLARTFMHGVTPAPVPKPMPHLVGHEQTKDGKTFTDADGNTWIWFNQNLRPNHDTHTYEYANIDAARHGPILKAKRGLWVPWLVAANNARNKASIWGTTRLGWRFRMSDLTKV